MATQYVTNLVVDASEPLGFSDGDEVLVSLNLDNEYEDVRILQGQISHDRTIFDEVTHDEIILSSDWGNLTFNEKTGIFIVEKLSDMDEDERVLSIPLQIEQAVTSNDEEVILTNLTILNEDNEVIDVLDQSFSFKLLEAQHIDEMEKRHDFETEEVELDYSILIRSIGYRFTTIVLFLLLAILFCFLLNRKLKVKRNQAILLSTLLFFWFTRSVFIFNKGFKIRY